MESNHNVSGTHELEHAMSQLQIGDTAPLFKTILGTCLEEKVYSLRKAQSGILTGRLVCILVIQTIQSLQKRELSKFDALVSECQCQLRAIITACVANELMDKQSALSLDLEKTKAELESIKNLLGKKAQTLSLKINNPQIIDTEITLQELFKTQADESLEICIPNRLIPLVLSYMLSLTKGEQKEKQTCTDCKQEVVGHTEFTDINKLNRLQKNTLKRVIDKMVLLAKQKLSEISCLHIQKLAQAHSKELASSMLAAPNQIVEIANVRTFSYSKTMLPLFYTLRAVYDTAIAQQIPIIIKSKKAEHSVEQQGHYDTIFVLMNNTLNPIENLSIKERLLPSLVVEGQRTGITIAEESVEAYQTRLLNASFLDILEMNAAYHPQYIGNRMLDSVPLLQENQNELNRLQELSNRASKEGCCITNQTLFRITHIFCDTIENQLPKGKSK